MQDAPKAVWSIPYVSEAFFPGLKQNFIAYHSSKISDCIFEIHRQWQSGFSRVYSNGCCSCSFEPETIKIGLSSQKIYSNNILNFFQESTTVLNTCTKKVWKLIGCTVYLYESKRFFISTGIFSDSRICIIHENEVDPLWISSLLPNRVTVSLNSYVPFSKERMYLCPPHSVNSSLSPLITAVLTSSSLA